jgi:hypothetical protein
LILTGQHPNPPAKGDQAQPDHRVGDALTDIARTYHEQTERAERSPESRKCEPGDDQRDSDLCAQWKAADAAANAAWWAAVGTWVSGGSGLLVLAALYLAFQSNRIAGDTAKRQLRSYVNVSKFEPSAYCVGQAFSTRVHFSNKGQTPAHDVIVRAYLARRQLPLDTATLGDQPITGWGSKTTLANGDPLSANVRFGHSVSEDEIAAFRDEKIGIYVYGWVSYKDIFGEKHITKYRAALQQDGLFAGCDDGNEAD